MKRFYLMTLFLFTTLCGHSQNSVDTTGKKIFYAIEQSAEFPGGLERFYNYIGKRLELREVEQLIGVVGKVRVSFVVDTTGYLTDIKVLSNIGCGCEEEVVHILSTCVQWKPAMQSSRNVRQRLSIPLTFNFPKETIKMAELRKAKGGYLFQIKDTVYNIDDAAAILGEVFPSTQVEVASIYNEPEKFNIKKKHVTYLVKIRS